MAEPAPEVTLRALTRADADEIAGWGLDDQFCAAAGWTAGLPYEHHQARHRLQVTDPPPDLLRFAAAQGDRLVGYVDLAGTEPDRRELGYVIGPRALWGQGLGLAAARAGLDHGFRVLGLREIWAEAADANVASVKILQRLGMVETGPGAETTYVGQPARHRRFTLLTP